MLPRMRTHLEVAVGGGRWRLKNLNDIRYYPTYLHLPTYYIYSKT
jgi:hypothetical protein